MEKIIQPKNSQLCGPACLAMVLNSIGGNFSVEEIKKELFISKEYGIGPFDLAQFPIKKGYKVKIYTWDAKHFPVRWREMNQQEIVKDLSKLKPKKGSWQQALLYNMEKGAKFFPQPISTKEIEKRLKNKEGMIMYLDSSVLYQHKGGIWGHYVVLKKTTPNYYTILDPHWKYGGEKRYPKDLILFAFYSVGGYCFFVSK